MLTTAAISFADISAQDCPIFLAFVLIGTATRQLTRELVIASSGMQIWFFLFFQNALIFWKWTPKIRNLKLKAKQNVSAKPKCY